jgi:predicted glycoside hydrolase/deacetylase ChbG (UPF0249 family)
VPALIITADDYGYHPRFDEGILRAARAGAVDAVSAFATREGLPAAALLETGVEVGLHLDLDGPPVPAQAHAFAARFGRAPAYLDGHRHRHAEPETRAAVAELALELDVPVRSVDAEHRRHLREAGIRTPDLVTGRLRESEPALPVELEGDPEALPAVTEWFVHPGLSEGKGLSSYDSGREEDLALVLELRLPSEIQRATHRILRKC